MAREKKNWNLVKTFLLENEIICAGAFLSDDLIQRFNTWGYSETRELSLEKAMAPHSSTLAWKIPGTEEPGRLQSMGLLRVGHNWVTSLSLFTFLHWIRKWQPTPVFLPGESQGQGEPGGLPSMGSHRVGHDWSDLAAAESWASHSQICELLNFWQLLSYSKKLGLSSTQVSAHILVNFCLCDSNPSWFAGSNS